MGGGNFNWNGKLTRFGQVLHKTASQIVKVGPLPLGRMLAGLRLATRRVDSGGTEAQADLSTSMGGAPSGTQLDAQQTATAVLPPVGCSSSAASSSTLRRVINVPMDCALYDTEGMCFTDPMQVQWIGQLLQRPHQFVLHADGKHKLHHGRWVLMTLGTHYLRYDAERDQDLALTIS